jgi:nicotinic acid phosphoribosyltransferase
MVEINGSPRIKLSEDVMKVTMPGKKTAYRLYGADGKSSGFVKCSTEIVGYEI